MYKTWQIDAFPCYLIIDRDGFVMSMNGIDVRDRYIDYILYAATKNIKPAKAMWIKFRQDENHRKTRRYTDDEEGRDYSSWFKSIVEKLVEDSGQKKL